MAEREAEREAGSGPGERVERQEVEALLETRRELGPTYDEALVDAFADRIEAAVAGTFADLPGIAVAWLGIVGVNAAHASAVNGRRDR